MDLSRRVAMVLGAALVAGVACQDMATAPRSSPARPSSFDVGPSTYGALWALTDAGFVLRHTVTPAGPVPPDAVDSARAGALRATFQGFASTHTLMSSSAPGSASGIGQANGANQARTRRAMRMTRLSLGKVDNKALMLGLVPGEGEDAPLAAIVISSDNQVSAMIQLQHTRRANGKWRLAQSRTTIFNKDRKAVAALDQSYGDPEFSSALRAGSVDLMKRFASLALPDALYAAEVDDEADCPVEYKAVLAASGVATLAGANVARAMALEAAAVGWLATALATCSETGITCAIIPAAETLAAAATAAVYNASVVLAGAIATLGIATEALSACVWAKQPKWRPAGTGGGGGGSGGGGGGGGGSWDCEYYVYVDNFGNVLEVDDPNGCLQYAE